jgi:hypothetical protein
MRKLTPKAQDLLDIRTSHSARPKFSLECKDALVSWLELLDMFAAIWGF